jgi:hypothetical protein
MRPLVITRPSQIVEVWCRRDRGGKHKTKVRRREREKKTDIDKPAIPYWKKEQINILIK